MYIMYVDESGDPGPYNGQNSPHFILSGLIISIEDWNECVQRLVKFREMIQKAYGLNKREEIHSSEMIRPHKVEAYKRIHKSDRVNIIRLFVAEMCNMFPNGRLINICLDKEHISQSKYSSGMQELAWKRLIQRYDTFLKKNKSKGIIVSDDSSEPTLRRLLRGMRVYNPVESRFGGYHNPVITNVIEDIFYRSSTHSFFIQAVDVIAFCLYRKEYPKGSLKKFGFHLLFDTLDSMCVKEASGRDAQGIVRV
ncbi:DUF3800 domain-containing protein [Solirubrum puertoriconensis]|uniref:DUF3800 domain-containing protein n=1 Tax=Solirubrum puertoriconensis TaxID=1751427 RepID=A0A9X0L667_SOLP1|nr:DUF3800 domain-containing protein [Solirubrum puertoriconensis]KUG09395.1 hypothetical protein ASU33_16840 [Solirubrum puertoriconensis]